MEPFLGYDFCCTRQYICLLQRGRPQANSGGGGGGGGGGSSSSTGAGAWSAAHGIGGGRWLGGWGITEVEGRERDRTLSRSQVDACPPKQSLKSLDLEAARRCTQAFQAIAIVKTESFQRRSPHSPTARCIDFLFLLTHGVFPKESRPGGIVGFKRGRTASNRAEFQHSTLIPLRR